MTALFNLALPPETSSLYAGVAVPTPTKLLEFTTTAAAPVPLCNRIRFPVSTALIVMSPAFAFVEN